MKNRWVFALSMTVLWGISFGVALNSVASGICLGLCMGMAFGLFDGSDGVEHTDKGETPSERDE